MCIAVSNAHRCSTSHEQGTASFLDQHTASSQTSTVQSPGTRIFRSVGARKTAKLLLSRNPRESSESEPEQVYKPHGNQWHDVDRFLPPAAAGRSCISISCDDLSLCSASSHQTPDKPPIVPLTLREVHPLRLIFGRLFGLVGRAMSALGRQISPRGRWNSLGFIHSRRMKPVYIFILFCCYHSINWCSHA